MTKIFRVDPQHINKNALKECAKLIEWGRIVVFPTETVYGLGANAFDEDAIDMVFKAKNRPQDNPLIVHVPDLKMLKVIVESISENAQKLIDKFWPGPLSIVFKKNPVIADNVSCGLDTVAVRMPSHPVARELINLSRVPIAAPSANISGKPSGTLADHTIEDLKGKVDAIIDAGNCKYGLESTVIDTTGKTPILLRPGGITLEEIEEVVGKVKVANPNAERPKCPGMKYRHYAPNTHFILIQAKNNKEIRVKLIEKYNELIAKKKKVVIISSKELKKELKLKAEFRVVGERNDLLNLAANIFHVLRQLDKEKYDCILMGSCPEEGIGLAIMNRIKKAASEVI